ncbi:O-antigen ligase family protein [Azoarcus sp. L1K30]|uniref:O-antigen ligase family protein n=1 Tax=Azoarcus sp. L1K30 TaxID=2820277 RepID=UPI001B82B908|nr:O-antigen ligase family protein [Azoarcus sp. L1K30]MBR0566812.1 O-antigen ligase family protein [Azoarcus sp. L1K30]
MMTSAPATPETTRLPRYLRTACDAAVWLAFAGLVCLRGPASPGTMGAALAIVGLILLVSRRDMRPLDLHMAAIFFIMPVHDTLNMLITGWNSNMLDKPGRLLIGFFVYFALSRIGVSARALRWGVICGCIAAALLAAYQVHVQGMVRATGFMNAIPFGNDSLLLGLFALAAWVTTMASRRTRALNACTLIALAASIYASFASETRGGWVVAPVLLWVVSLGVRNVRPGRRGAVATGIVSLLLIGLAVLPLINDRTAAELGSSLEVIGAPSREAAEMELSSIGTRIHLYHIGTDAFLSSPLYGIGIANLGDYLAAGAKTGKVNPAVTTFTHLHSGIIDTLARGGLLGLAALSFFSIGLIRFFCRPLATMTDPDVRYFALTGLLGIAAALLFSLSNVIFPAIAGTNILVMTLAVPAGALAYRLRQLASDSLPGVHGASA